MKLNTKENLDRIIDHRYDMETLQVKNPFISVKNLVKDFDLKDYIIRAVDHVDLEIRKHEYVALIGHSGAGKTTLLHMLAGLEKSTKGEIFLNHINITPMDDETLTIFRIFTVGLIFQNYNLISSFTALENVMFPMQMSGATPSECERKAQNLLEKIGLEERANHLPFQLSAGEQQRVAIARALINDPPIIVADEPTANLDKYNANFIAGLFEELRNQGKTIIVATHDEKLIDFAHRLITLDDGAITSDEPVMSLSSQEVKGRDNNHKYISHKSNDSNDSNDSDEFGDSGSISHQEEENSL